MYTIPELARVANTLIILGRAPNRAIHDVASSYGLTREDVVQLVKLVINTGDNK